MDSTKILVTIFIILAVFVVVAFLGLSLGIISYDLISKLSILLLIIVAVIVIFMSFRRPRK